MPSGKVDAKRSAGNDEKAPFLEEGHDVCLLHARFVPGDKLDELADSVIRPPTLKISRIHNILAIGAKSKKFGW